MALDIIINSLPFKYAIRFHGLPAAEAPSRPLDPPAFGPNCVGCITTLNVANGAITHPKIALHSVDQTQLTFVVLLSTQVSSSHIFGTLGIPATSGLAIGLVAGLVKS